MYDKGKLIYFIEGPIPPGLIAETVGKQNLNLKIGAHSIFVGQVRNDFINEKEVAAIEYSCYREMASDVMDKLIHEVQSKYDLHDMEVYHSLGKVMAGDICLFVFTASRHRRNAIEGCNELVEKIKKELPVWGKEVFEDENYEWKKNT